MASAPVFGDGEEVVWRTGPAELERSRLAALMRREGVADPESPYRRAAADPDRYWRTAVTDLGVEFTRPFDAIVDSGDGPELPKTKTAKLMRRLVRARDLDAATGDLSSLESTTALDGIPTMTAEDR